MRDEKGVLRRLDQNILVQWLYEYSIDGWLRVYMKRPSLLHLTSQLGPIGVSDAKTN